MTNILTIYEDEWNDAFAAGEFAATLRGQAGDITDIYIQKLLENNRDRPGFSDGVAFALEQQAR